MPRLDIDDVIKDLSSRVRKLEMHVTNGENIPEEDKNPIVDSIQFGEGAEAVLIDRTVNPPESFTAEAGVYFDDIFIDVSWVLPESGAVAVQVDLAIKDVDLGTYSLVDTTRASGNTHRFSGLQPNSTYGVRVEGVSHIGITTTEAVWLDVETGEDETIPPPVTNVVMARGATSLVVKWTPLTETQARDVARGAGVYRVEVDTSANFDSGNLRTDEGTSYVRAFTDITTPGTWYGRVAPIDASGNQGPWVNATAITAGGVNNAMIVADLSAAKITFGEMDGDRITANSMDLGRLEAGSVLASKELVIGAGGAFKVGNPPTTGMFINSQGISLYGGGVQKVFLDASSGNAMFKGTVDASTVTGSEISGTNISGGTITGTTITGGTFQTATSGSRMVIDQSEVGRIRFYNSSGTLVGRVGIDAYGEFNYGTAHGMHKFMNIGMTAVVPISADIVHCAGVRFDQGGIATTVGTVIDSGRYGYFTGITMSGGLAMGGYSIGGVDYLTAVYLNGRGFDNRLYFQNGNANMSSAGAFNAQSITAGTKSFRIDHPVLGDEHDLIYSSIEGPAMDLIYRGRAKLTRGKAIVNIDEVAKQHPGTFEALTLQKTAQAFVHNETNNQHIAYSLEGALLTLTSSAQDATAGWMLIVERGDDTAVEAEWTDTEGRLKVERRRTPEEVEDARRRRNPPQPVDPQPKKAPVPEGEPVDV